MTFAQTTSLSVAGGGGRVFRTASHIGFSSEPIEGLYEAILAAEDDPSRVFKQLAALIVSNDFSLPSFVVVRLGENPAAFVSGDLVLATAASSDSIDGASSSTWTERQLTVDQITHLQTGIDPATTSSSDTTLERGIVCGGGFSFGFAGPDETDVEASEPEPEWTPPKSEPHALESEDDPVQVDPNFDPFADPENVDLEKLGSIDPIDNDVDSVPPAIATPDVNPVHNSLSAPVESSAPVDSPAPSPIETVLPTSTETPTGVSNIPSPPSSPPPLRDQEDELTGQHTIPGPPNGESSHLAADELTISRPRTGGGEPSDSTVKSASVGLLRFDDGQVHELTQSLLVGRYPTKQGLPDGFDSIVIRGEHVSRIHWELRIENGQAWASDLGSTSGTSVEHPGDPEPIPLVAGDSRRLNNGAKIQFGDRWVTFETWRG